jgi:hypothetical protein
MRRRTIMQTRFAVICRHPWLDFRPTGGLEVDARGITDSLFVPAIPYRLIGIYFLAFGRGSNRYAFKSEWKVSVIGPTGDSAGDPLLLNERLSEGNIELWVNPQEDQWVISLRLDDVEVRDPGTHHVLMTIDGAEAIRVPFEVAVLSKD